MRTITPGHLQWAIDRLRLGHIHETLNEMDRGATEFASRKIAVPTEDLEPSSFGEAIKTFSFEEGPTHSHMLFSETGDLLLQVPTENPLFAEFQKRLKEMWHTDPRTLFLGLVAWYIFPHVAKYAGRSPYMPGYWIQHFVQEKESLPWQEQRMYFVGIDKLLWEIRAGEWILPLYQIGTPNLTERSLNRIRLLVDMFLHAEKSEKAILQQEQQRLAMGSKVLADIEEALAHGGSEELPPAPPRETRE